MADTKIKAGQFFGVVGHGTDGYFLMTNADGSMSWSQASTGPSVTSVDYPGDDTAADPAGGQTVVLTGTNFGSSMTVSIGGTTAPSVSHDSSTQLTITTPAKAAGDYDIVVTNTVTGASGTFVNGISYNGIPTWTTPAGSLGIFESETTISTITLQATEPDGGTITFNITNGALPTGLSLTGANIDGTTTAESSTTLYSFTIEAIDDENQSTPRNFSITVNASELTPSENFTINTYTGNGSTQSIEGKIGTAAAFNGSSSYISLDLDSYFNTWGDLSYSLWFNTTNTNYQRFITAFNSSNYLGNAGLLGTGAVNNNTRVGGTDYYGNGTTTGLNDGNWHHFAWVLDNTSHTVKMYVDGSLEATTDYGSTQSGSFSLTNGALLGIAQDLSSNSFNGKIDQVRIFDKALSLNEVTTLYGEPSNLSTASTTDIFGDGSGVALYEFEEGAKDTGGISGYIGNGGTFNGLQTSSASYVDISSSTTSTTSTVSFWMNTTIKDSNTGTMLDAGGGSSANTGFSIVRTPTNGYLSVNFTHGTPGQNQAFTGTTDICDGTWHHISLVMESDNTFICYLDGVSHLSGTRTYWTSGDTHNLSNNRFGTNAGSLGASSYEGKIDQVRIFNKALSSSEVTTLYGETSASATKSTKDIFDDGSGVALYELEGNANDTVRAIDSGQSAVFNGTTSIFNFPNTAYGASTTVFTVSGWFKHTSTANNREDIYFGNGATVGGNTGYALFTDYSSGNIALSFRDTDQSQVFYTSSSSIKDGSWYHLCLTYNNGAYVVYLNGASILNGTSPDFINNQTPTHATYIGNRYGNTGSGASIIGAVDQVRVYSSALSASDVEALVSETNVPTANLVAHYKLDGNANDETGSYNGTATSITYSDPAEYPTYDGTATNVSYAYDGTPTNVSFVGTSFQPDLVWIKSRSDSDHHVLLDSIRGGTNPLMPSGTSAEIADTDYIQSFDSNGFTVRVDTQRFDFSHNESGDPLVAWCWKAGGTVSANNNTDGSITSTVSANTDAGFSIATYTGNNTQNATVGHGLGIEQKMVIIKRTDAANSWWVPLPILGSNKFMELNTTAAATTDSQYQYTQTSDVFKFTSSSQSAQYNASGGSYVMYSFADIDGYQKVGSYTGNGSSAKTVYTTFEPRWIMIKRTDSTGDWYIYDQLRDGTNDRQLYANLSDQESTTSDVITYNSDGFTIAASGSGVNASGGTYIYLAIA